MRDALLRDLAEIADVETVVTYDARLAAPAQARIAIPVDVDDEVHAVWSACMRETDATWLIAPETQGVLSTLSAMALEQGKPLLGCTPETIALMADKYQTYRALAAMHIPAVSTYRPGEWPSATESAWVTKPDDGVGCEGVRFHATTADLTCWLAAHGHARLLVQPYVAGVAASLSMLCRDGHAWLLSCNRQKVDIDTDAFHYTGSVVNALAADWALCETLAMQLAAAFPGLRGYVGVDVIRTPQGLQVVEINPRLTTSYAGLHASIGCNPARLILDLLYNAQFHEAGFELPEQLSRRIVEVTP